MCAGFTAKLGACQARLTELKTELETLDGERDECERKDREAARVLNEATQREADLVRLRSKLDKVIDVSTGMERKKQEVEEMRERIATYTSSVAAGSKSLDEVGATATSNAPRARC